MHGFIFEIEKEFFWCMRHKIRREEEFSVGTTPIAIKTQAGGNFGGRRLRLFFREKKKRKNRKRGGQIGVSESIFWWEAVGGEEREDNWRDLKRHTSGISLPGESVPRYVCWELLTHWYYHFVLYPFRLVFFYHCLLLGYEGDIGLLFSLILLIFI